eukprot:1617310-Rhodomonas_salina.2
MDPCCPCKRCWPSFHEPTVRGQVISWNDPAPARHFMDSLCPRRRDGSCTAASSSTWFAPPPLPAQAVKKKSRKRKKERKKERKKGKEDKKTKREKE